MSYLRYLCLLAHSGVQQILRFVLLLFFLRRTCVPYVASFSGFSERKAHNRLIEKRTTVGVTNEGRHTYRSGSPEFTLVSLVGPCCASFNIFI
jgi:hypothetical protein